MQNLFSVSFLSIRIARSAAACLLAAGSCLTHVTIVLADDLVTIPVKTFKDLDEAAKELAAKPYQPQPPVPDSLRNLTYDQFRYIGFRDGQELWGETILPFRIGFYHKGYVHVDDVSLNVINPAGSNPVPFSKRYFHYLEAAKELDIPDNIGFAGFRVKGTFPEQTELSEIFSFVGASYFRARSAKSVLGTSTRGLAIDCGLPKTEEFPVFREYWIAQPNPGDKALKVYALLDSPSVAGAYEFLLTPGTDRTEIDIHQRLYFRQVPEKVGIAPMSSMWMWGDALPGPQGDHRPEVHDADGLQVEGPNGQWLWRALGQQNYPSIIQLKYDGVKGFGLIQRDTQPNHYLDDEARYDVRPSVWIQPQSNWGPGRIELLEIPAPHEGIDNIAVWWVPDSQVTPGSPVEFSYRISYFLGDCPQNELAKAVAHRVQRDESGKMNVEVDFTGPGIAERDAATPPEIQVISIRGEVLSKKCEKRPSGVWTARMEVQPTKEGPVEFQVSLMDGQAPLTETWAYLCPLTAPKVSLPPWKVKEPQEKEQTK